MEKRKTKILITLSSSGQDDSPLDVLDFIKRTRSLNASGAVSLALMEWYQWRVDSIQKHGTPHFAKDEETIALD